MKLSKLIHVFDGEREETAAISEVQWLDWAGGSGMERESRKIAGEKIKDQHSELLGDNSSFKESSVTMHLCATVSAVAIWK